MYRTLTKEGFFLFSLVSNVCSVPRCFEIQNINYQLKTESLVCPDLYTYVDRL